MYPPVDYSASSSLKRSQRSTDDLDLALTLAQQGIYDPLNPAHAQLLSSSALPEHITTRPPPEQEDEQMNDYFKAHYKDWLESEFFGSTDDGVQESMAELLRELQEEDGVEYGGIEWSHERESGRVSSSEHRDAGKRVILFENRESVRGWIAEDVPMTQVSYGWDESFPSED